MNLEPKTKTSPLGFFEADFISDLFWISMWVSLSYERPETSRISLCDNFYAFVSKFFFVSFREKERATDPRWPDRYLYKNDAISQWNDYLNIILEMADNEWPFFSQKEVTVSAID